MFDHRWLTPSEVESMRRDRNTHRASLERRQAAHREARRHHRERAA